VELVVGQRGRGGVTRGFKQSPIGGPQLGDRLRVEWRRLPQRDALEDQQGRNELAQLGGIEQIRLAQMLGDRLNVWIARAIRAESVWHSRLGAQRLGSDKQTGREPSDYSCKRRRERASPAAASLAVAEAAAWDAPPNDHLPRAV
jgi:hypothetical protein